MNKVDRGPRVFQKPWHSLATLVVGVDEVGRGCLAGPVVSCALSLKDDSIDHQLFDSKSLKAQTREEITELLSRNAVYAIGEASVEEIDQLNILQASLLSMERAVSALQKKISLKEALILVDGNKKIPGIPWAQQRAVIRGDSIYAPISAASIVAKVYRDNLMKGLDVQFPNYAFGVHKGYGTSVHKEAIKAWGPSLVHRRSFKGVKEFFSF
jgi:ribonuclease HII